MRISGFGFVRNATKLYYPVAQSVASALPLVDEFVMALGPSDPDDHTRQELLALNSPKLRIVDTVWDLEAYPNGTENAHQTDLAKAHCTGDWLLYLQADEVLHEADLDPLHRRCHQLLNHPRVEGLLFDYLHFWGDYAHVHRAHGWYRNEIRVVRNLPDVHSWESAQSFRRIPNFDGRSYRQKAGSHKLRVARAGARIFHYGWVRPPDRMVKKSLALDTIHKGEARAQALYAQRSPVFDYGPMARIPAYTGSHPAVMHDWMARLDWQDQLRQEGPWPINRQSFKHERWKNRALGWVEHHLLGGRSIGGFNNYRLVRV